MKRLQTIHKIPKHALLAVRNRSHSLPTSILTSESSQIITDIRRVCPLLPLSTTATVAWNTDMPSNVLAWTYTSYKKEGDSWVSSNTFDIEFNSHFNWHVDDTCSTQARTHYDLRTAMIHEILHGIGFASTIGADKKAYPSQYDLLLRMANGHEAIQSNQYMGAFGDKIYIDHVQIYNPSTYSSGSSFSHVAKDGNIMSWSQDACHRQIDSSTQHVLSRLGYGCEQPQHGKNGVDYHHVFIVAAIMGGIVVLCLSILLIKCGGRKHRFVKDELRNPFLSGTGRKPRFVKDEWKNTFLSGLWEVGAEMPFQKQRCPFKKE